MNSTFEPDIDSLLKRARDGEGQAVSGLIEQYRPYLRLLARLHVGRNLQSKLDESDVVQETSMVAATRFSGFQGQTEQELTAWLRGILAHVAAKMARHFHRQRRDIRQEYRLLDEFNQSSVQIAATLCSEESSPSERTHRRERAVILAEALQQLPDVYREVLILRQFDGLTIKQIATRLDRSCDSVQKLWVRALLRMRTLMKEFDERSR